MTGTSTILTEQRGRVGLLTLNRPDALNALNSQLMTEVVDQARASYLTALELTRQPAERRFLQARLAQLAARPDGAA